jgi:hypothetical protein
MTVLNESSLPYPGMDLAQERAKQHARAAGVDTAPAPVYWYAPGQAAADMPSGAVVPQPVPPFTPVTAPALDVRRPGASCSGPAPRAAAALTVTDLALLKRTRDSLKRLPRVDEKIYAAAFSEHHGTASRPVAAPAPAAPRSSVAEDLARFRLADIVYAAALHAEPPYGVYCPDCKAADSGWCEPCGDAAAKSEALYRLHDLILAADTFAAAVVMAGRSLLSPMVVHAEGRR